MRVAVTASEREAMGWEDVLGLVVTVGLLWYLLWAMLKAEKV